MTLLRTEFAEKGKKHLHLYNCLFNSQIVEAKNDVMEYDMCKYLR